MSIPSDNLSKEEMKMSRIGRLPVVIPGGVTVDVTENNQVTVKGPKGTLEKALPYSPPVLADCGYRYDITLLSCNIM